MVGDAQASKVPIQRIVDVVSGYFTPLVLILSVLGFVIWYDFGPAPAFAYADDRGGHDAHHRLPVRARHGDPDGAHDRGRAWRPPTGS